MAEQVSYYQSIRFFLTFTSHQRLRGHTKNKIFSIMPNPVVRCTAWTLPPPYLTCILGGKKLATKEKRWYKDVGLGFKTPSEAISGTYIGAWSIYVIYMPIMTWSSRQKMPFHWRHLDSRSYPYWQGRVHQDEPNHHYPSWLPTLHSKIQYVVVCRFCMAYLIWLQTVTKSVTRIWQLTSHPPSV